MNIRTILLLLPALTLSACGDVAPEPAAAETPTVEEQLAQIKTIAAPDKDVFAAALAATCPGAKPVSAVACKRQGIGSDEVLCKYGLGDDTYLRNKATLTPLDGEWTIADDPKTVCAAGA